MFFRTARVFVFDGHVCVCPWWVPSRADPIRSDPKTVQEPKNNSNGEGNAEGTQDYMWFKQATRGLCPAASVPIRPALLQLRSLAELPLCPQAPAHVTASSPGSCSFRSTLSSRLFTMPKNYSKCKFRNNLLTTFNRVNSQ